MSQHPNKLERSLWKFDSESLSRFWKCQNELLIGVSICILLWFYFRSLALSIWNIWHNNAFSSQSWFGVIVKTQQVSLSIQCSVFCSNPTASSPRWAARFRSAAHTLTSISRPQNRTDLEWIILIALTKSYIQGMTYCHCHNMTGLNWFGRWCIVLMVLPEQFSYLLALK